MGERIGMDIANMIWDRVCHIIENYAYESMEEKFIEIFAMECPFTRQEFENTRPLDDLCEKAYEAAMATFKEHVDAMTNRANPVIKQVYEQQGQMYENILVPVTDGRRIYQITVNLKEAYETEGKALAKEFEKAILLHTIDEAWKENLRQLDELKHSVNNASYEQKDPLLIFKLESVKLFDAMVNVINNKTISVLMRGQIPMPRTEEPAEVQQTEASEEAQAPAQQPQQPQQPVIQEAPREMPRPGYGRPNYGRPQYTEGRGELGDPAQRAAAARDTREQQPRQPLIADKIPGRNDLCPCGSGQKFKNCHGKGL